LTGKTDEDRTVTAATRAEPLRRDFLRRDYPFIAAAAGAASYAR